VRITDVLYRILINVFKLLYLFVLIRDIFNVASIVLEVPHCAYNRRTLSYFNEWIEVFKLLYLFVLIRDIFNVASIVLAVPHCACNRRT
jgi:hypothetical protein